MSNKAKIILSVIGVAISTALLVISAIFVEEELISPVLATAFVSISVLLVIAAISFAAKADYETGIYKCRKCGNTFKPTFGAYLLGAHTLTARHLKCPKCEEKSWCKRKTEK